MSDLQFVAVAAAHESSELRPAIRSAVDPGFTRELARAQDAAGFDAILAHDSSSSIDAAVLAQRVLAEAERTRVIITQRPGVLAPTAAARQVAGLDALHPGRVGVHIPAVDSDREAQRDGDWVDRAARQRRRAEYAEILHRSWTSERPFDFDGEFYRVVGTWTPIRPIHPIPIQASGASPIADEFGAQYADTYFLPSLPAEELVLRITAASGHARRAGRIVRFGVRLRPILAASHAEAQRSAERVVRVHHTSFDSPRRALRAVTGEVAGAGSLIGTPAEVAAVLDSYRALGIGAIRLASWQPLDDVELQAQLIECCRDGGERKAG